MAKWTCEQQRAIDVRDKNVLVSAAAGSGKTAVLVERILKIITDESLQVDVDNLLVVTFTNAAAAEMKARIADAVMKKIEKMPESIHLHKQLALLNKSYITTIDSFCKKVVAANYIKLDVDPAVRIADESECSLLKTEAVEALLEDSFEDENNTGFFMLAENMRDETGFENLKNIIIKVYNFVQSSPFPEKWLKDTVLKYKTDKNTAFEDTFFGEIVIENLIKSFEDLCCESDSAYAFAPEEYKAALDSDHEGFKVILNVCRNKNFGKIIEAVDEFEFERLSRLKDKTMTQRADMVKNVREDVKKNFKKIKEKYLFRTPAGMEEDMCESGKIIEALCQTVLKFSEKYDELKKEKAVVDFSGLEHLAIKALYDFDEEKGVYVYSKEAEEMQNMFYEVLTDEYQDSNFVQEMILEAVSGRGKAINNRFMVGDVKQSIYRFRQAAPDIFMEKYYSYNNKKGCEKILLFKNFRSRKNILDATNFIFRQIMNSNTGEMDYDDEAALFSGVQFPFYSEEYEESPVELDIIDLNFEEAVTDEDTADFTAAQKELTYIAGKIKKMMETGYMVFDKEKCEYRKIRYNDIVVLLRSAKNWAASAEEIFEKYEIPVYSGNDSGYFDKKEIAVAVSLLKIIDNIYQDIPLLTVLKSYIYDISDDDLAEIKYFNGCDSFVEDIYGYIENGENNLIIEKLKRFDEDVKRWKKLAPFITVRELLWKIYNETGYYDYVGALPMGNVKQANLNLLLEKADTVAKGGIKSLFDFLLYIDKLEKNAVESGEAKILSESENLVRIMTIHKSKGLEFPIVFLSGLGKKFNMLDINTNVLMHKDLGLACDYINIDTRIKRKTLAKAALAEKIESELKAEEMRVLYVAMTRAKEKLIMTGTVRNAEKSCEKWAFNCVGAKENIPDYYIKSCTSYIDWIGAAAAIHTDGKILREAMTEGLQGEEKIFRDKINIVKDDSKWNISVIKAWNTEEENTFSKNQEEERHQEAMEINSEIYDRLTFKYEYEKYAEIASNISISEIKRLYSRDINEEEQAEEIIYKKPLFTMETTGLSAAQKGTAVHTVMEHIDFRKQYDSETLQKAVEEMAKKYILTAEEKESISINKILKFMNSTVGERLRNAQEIKRELPFAMEISAYEAYGNDSYKQCDDGVLVHGIIDCCFMEKNKTVLLDYKTDFVPKGEESTYFDRYKIQLDVYSRAIERAMGKLPDEIYIYSFGLGKFISMK